MSDTLITWPRRYTFNEWRQLSRNKHLTLSEAQELYRRESIKYTLLEQELLQLNFERQNTINNSLNSLQAYVINVVNGYNSILNATPMGRSTTPLETARNSPPAELITEDEFLLMTEAFEHLITE